MRLAWTKATKTPGLTELAFSLEDADGVSIDKRIACFGRSAMETNKSSEGHENARE